MPVIRGPPPPVELIYAEKEKNIESPPIPQIADTFFSEEIATTPIEEKNEEKKLHQELFSVSPIHGLGFIHSSKNPLEILFWYLLIIVFIGIMIKDICQLVKQYQVKPTTTQVKMNFNKTIKPPLMFLCIPISLEDVENVIIYENQTHFGVLSSVLNGLETKEQFLNSTDSSLFITMYQYLATFGMAENAYGNSPVDMSYIKYSENPRERSLRNLEKKIISLNITQDEIIRKTSATLAKMLNMEVTWVKIDGYHSGAASDYGTKLALVDSDQSCFKIDLNEIKSANEFYAILVNMAHFSNQNDDYSHSVSILFDGQDYEPSITEVPKVSAETGTLMKSRIEITGLFTVLSDENGKQRCSQLHPETYCIQDCRARFIYQKCGCVPLFGPAIPWAKGKITCSLSGYSECLKLAVTDDQACFTACLPHCIKWTYRLDSTTVPNDSPTASVFVLAFTNFIYPNFQEVYALSWQNFLGDCGGTLGLWLGASFLSIIHIIIVACKLVIAKFKFHWQCKRKISTVPKQVQTVD